MRTAALALSLLLPLVLRPASGLAQPQSDSTYTVRSGDTLFSIADRFGVSVQALQRWNELPDSTVEVGQILRIRPPRDAARPASDPLAPADSAAPGAPPDTGRVPPERPPPYGHHTAEQGDTFVSLALRLGTTADTLFALNDRATEPLSPGRTLRLPRRFGPPTHVVQPGETVYSIAGEYGVSARALRAANDLDTTALSPGRRLRLPGHGAPAVPPRGEWAVPDSTGPVAVYPSTFAGRLTTSGVPYEPEAFVVSHPSLPYGSVVLLSIAPPERHVFARVIDRGPLDESALLDVSAAVAEQLGIDGDASPTAALRVVWVESPQE